STSAPNTFLGLIKPPIEREWVQAHAVKLNVAAELLGKLAGLLQSGGIEDWSADALLLPRAIRQGQGAPEAQPFAGWGDLNGHRAAQILESPVHTGEIRITGGHGDRA
ncbi:MAG: hypothetical protein ACK6BG_10925, partial [Cyanobacteriota bacterium]